MSPDENEPIVTPPPSDPADPNSFENFKQAGVFPTKEATIEALEMIRSRAEQLAEKWLEEKKTTREIALAYADLENDFAYVQDISRFTSVRYDQVMRILPTPEELDGTIETLDQRRAELAAMPEEIRTGEENTQLEYLGRRVEMLRLLKNVVMKFHAIRAQAREERTS